MLLLFCALSRQVHAADPWLQPWGPGDLSWGTSSMPLDAMPRSRAYVLPDSGYVGTQPKDQPQDFEIEAPAGERRFLRYVNGQLVDAWWVVQGDLDASAFKQNGREEWQGVVLGPLPDNWRAFGWATSWVIGDRTALYWEDRASDTHILASRGVPTATYAVRRASPLVPEVEGRYKAKIKGDMARWVKPQMMHLSGCLELSTKPVEAFIEVMYNDEGLPTRIRSTADQTAPGLTECAAAAIAHTHASVEGQQGSFTVIRAR